jgi:hypothetical protein
MPPIEGESMMTEMNFAGRLTATGLRPTEADIPKLEALVKDMDRAAALVRGPRPYNEEPLSVFRLPRP